MRPRSISLLPIVGTLVLAAPSHASVFYWDGTDTTANADGGSGNWDTALTNWDTLATAGADIAWPSVSSGNDDAAFGGLAGTVTINTGVAANDLTFTTTGYNIAGGILTLDGTTPTITADANAEIGSQIAGSAGLLKAGAATLTLSGANTYTGTTTISGGTLALTGGNNRLATSGTLSFAANGTVNLGGNSQTLANLSILTASANTKGTLTNGSLTLNGASALTITPSVTTGGRVAEIDASGLSSLTISKTGQSITVGGLNGAVSPGNSAIFRLSAVSNSITASSINVGTTGGANASGIINKGELELGASNTIYSDTWNLGTIRDGGIVRFQTGLVNPAVTMRAQDGSSRVTKITIGQNSAGSTAVGTSSLELALGSVDLMVTDLVLSKGASTSTNKPAVNGYFSMGGGSVDATNIWISKNEGSGLNTTNTAHFYQLAGNVKVSTLTLADTVSVSTSNIPTFNSQYTLNSGILSAANIKAGAGVFSSSTIRRINFNGGTITHFDSATNLTIDGVTGTGGTIGIVLGTDGSPTILVNSGRTVTLGAFTSLSGSGSLTKTGTGTLSVNGTGTYTGATAIQEGTVVLGGNDRLSTATDLSLANTSGALLSLNNFNQTLGSLAGGGTNGGNISLGTGILKVGNANTTTFGGQLSGTGSFVKVGAGSLTLSGNTAASLAGINTSGGTLEITSGNYTVTGTVGTGSPDSTTGFVVSRGGTFRLNGGNVTATSGTYLFTAGNTGGGTSNFILDSGNFNADGREVLNAYGADGTTTINGGLFICQGFKVSQSTSGILNLNGGTLRAVYLYNGGSTVNFNGGTLQARADRSDFVATSVTTAQISAGGAVIDSNGFAITIPKSLTEKSDSTGGGLTKIGNGTLTLSGSNTYTGATTITGGTLALTGSGSISSSSAIIVGANTTFDVSGVTGGFTLASGQTISGPGALAGTMNVSGTLSPGSSPGTLSTENQTWLDGGDYNWQILDANGAAGTGYDTIAITGTLDLSSLATGGFNINLWSLSATGPDVSGNALNFVGSNNYSWTIASATSGITGFDAADFIINPGALNGTSGFSNALGGGSFTLSQSGNNLVLNFTAVPEPGPVLLGGLGLLALLRRRR